MVEWWRGGEDIFTGELCVSGDAVEVTDFGGRAYRFDLVTGADLSDAARG